MALLSRLFGAKKSDFKAPIAPDQSFCAVADIHGCATKLQMLLEKLETEHSDSSIVFVGDYVDRGEESAEVLKTVMAKDDDPNVTCLIGNHEEMLLNFLDQPEIKGSRWLRYGGLQTLASFGVRGVNERSSGSELTKAAGDLRQAMGGNMIAWLSNLPTHWISGNITVVHAAADPNMPISQQTAKTLRWGHPDFETTTRADDIWVLHGHTIVDQPYMTSGRIAIDTGAYATGRLTAAKVTPGNVEFIQV